MKSTSILLFSLLFTMMIAHTAGKLAPLDSHLGSNPRSTFIDFDPSLLEGPHPMTTDLKRMISTCRALPDHVGDLAKSRKFQPIQYWSHSDGKRGFYYRVEVQLDSRLVYLQFYKGGNMMQQCMKLEG